MPVGAATLRELPLVGETSPELAAELVDLAAATDRHALLRAEIGGTVEAERQKEAADYYRRLRASGKAPVKEPKPAKDPGAQTRGHHA